MKQREAGARAARIVSTLPERVLVRRLSVWAVVAASSLVYANALANGFVLDDHGVLRENPLVTSPSSAWRAFALPYWPEAIGGGQYRPLAIVSFAIDWAIGAGSPAWLHAMNIVWHAAVSAVVLLLAAELLAPAGALVAGLAFAVHPVHVEAVANTVGRLESMAALFVLIALIAHRRGSWAAPPLFAAALSSKESAIVFIALAALNDALMSRSAPDAFRVRRWWYAAYAGVVAAYVIVLAALFAGDRTLSLPSRALADATLGERLLTVGAVIPHYVRLLLVPFDLSADYEPGVIPLVRTVSTEAIAGWLLFVTVVIVFVRLWRHHPVMAFALGWIPTALAPVSNVFFTSGVVLAERTLYLPSVGACLLLGWGFDALVRRTEWLAATPAASDMRASFGRVRPAHLGVVLAVVLVAYAGRTWTRSPAWRDDRTYLLTLLADHPESYRAHLVAGRVAMARRDLPAAERELVIARRIFARDALVYREAAAVAAALGRVAEAEALLDTAVALKPRDAESRRRLEALRAMRTDP